VCPHPTPPLSLTHVRKGVAARFIAPGREGSGCEARPHHQRHEWRDYACTGRLKMCRGESPTPLRQPLQQMTVIAPAVFAVEPGHAAPELAHAALWQPSHVLLTG